MADITVTGQQAYFNEDAKFFKDVYVYGTLYYDFDFDTDNLVVDNLTVNEQLNLDNLFVSGISSFIGFSTFTSSVFLSQDLYVTGIATLGGLDVDNLIVGIATVQQRFELTDVGGTNYFVGFATGSYAGRVGIGSTLPEQKLDIGGAVRINTNIFDSVNSAGASGYFLSRDGAGIRWVAPNPALIEGIFVQNESVNVGVGSFTTLNFIGTRSGGDIVNVTADGVVANIDIIDHWTKNGSGIHTTANVGINVANPSFGLDVGADAYFRNPVEFESAVFVDAGLIVSGFTTGTISTALFANVTGFATNAQRAGFATFADFAGISTFSIISGFATNAQRAGFSTFSDFAGISTFSVISGFSTNSERAGFATFSDFAGISTFAVISGFSTNSERAGFATFSDFAGISTFAIISGFATNAQRAGFATFSDFAGISTFSVIAGFATNAQRAGFATFSDFSGISTFASTSGVSTNIRTVATSTNQDYFLTFVENATSTGIETVRVDSGITYNPGLNALGVDGTLEVGIGGSVITTTGIGSVGFGSVTPTREVDFQKDVRFQKAIYDVNDNVGFRSEYYQVPRNVLTTVGVDTSGNIIGGRFYDAANLIRLNLDFIANEAIGFLTSTDYKNPAFTIVNSVGVATDPVNCKDDIKDILKAITYDIVRGGNSRSVGAGLSYYTSGGVLQHITGTDLNGYSVKDATIAAIQKSVEISRFVINNSFYPTSYQMSAINGTYADAGRLILRNKDFIAAEAVDRTISAYPSLVIPGGNQSCIDDIKLILDAIIYNIQFGGNSRVYDAAKFYTLNPVLSGEEAEAIYAYQEVKTIAIQIIRNETVTKNSSILNTYTQFKDLSVLPDPISPTCQSQASAITSFVGIVTSAIDGSGLPTRTEPTISIPISQIRDLTLQNDPLRGSNTDPDGCSNVVSAITVCAGIVTTIINNGPSASPKVTNPNGKIVWAPAGADSRNIIYVSKYGNDDNNGRTEGAAKLTIGAAAAIAQPGDTIMVRSGVYAENNPIGLRTDVSVSGQDLRLVTIYPQNDDDVFYVRRGCLIENLSFAYSKDPYDDAAPISIRGGAVAFPPPAGIGSARSGFLDPGPCNEGPSGRWRSPYIRNCTNFMTNSIGMKINGNHVAAAFTGTNNLGQDLKCMVCDSFTQYNENGIGVSITNNGYAQLVSIFTINCNVGVYCDTGGSCDITNSNSSFGNYGLYANGVGAVEFTGITTGGDVTAEQDTYVFTNVRDTLNNVRKPFDGQALFFKIDLADYNDVGGATGIVTAPLRTVRSVRVTNGGSGYSETAPPNVTISTPGGPEAILAELSANVSAAGTITSIDVIASGRNFLPDQPVIISISGGGGATAEAIMDPIYFTVNTASEPTNVGLTTVTFNEFIPYSVGAGTSVEFRRISRIITSNISFEYIGAGVDINRSNPFQGGVPVPENEVVAINGGQVPFTSTDQKGNFRIGSGLTIDQTTATISGRDFNRAIQANLTPLILALGGG